MPKRMVVKSKIKRYLYIALSCHFLLHIYLSSASFIVVSHFLPVDRYIFTLLIFLASSACELYDHLKRNFNYMGDKKSAAREVILLSLVVAFVYALSLVKGFYAQKVSALLASVAVIMLSYCLPKRTFIKPDRSRHSELKHVLDIVSLTMGPLFFADLITRLIR